MSKELSTRTPSHRVDARTRESEPLQENEWRLCVPSLRIAGQPGAGKTTIADGLAELYGLTIVKIGQLDRQQTATDTGYRRRSDTYDLRLDAGMMDILRLARKTKPVIVEAHLAGVFGNKIDAEREDKGASLLVVAHEPIRGARIMIRQNEIKRAAGKPELTLEETIAQTRKRHAGNLDKWRRLYPDDIGDADPFDPESTNPQGKPFADILVDTTLSRSTEESIRLAHEALVEAGYVERIPKYDKPEEIIIYNAA